MKKLTAGIFATILGVTAMGAADAAVTSKGYVDAALATKASASEVSELSTTVSGHTAQINTLNTTAATHATKEEVATVQGNVDTLAGTVGTIPTTATATTVVGYVDEKTSGIASEGTVSALSAKVTALETASAKHAIKTEVDAALAGKADASALNSYVTVTDYNNGQTAQNEQILANQNAIDAIEADYLKANDIANLATKSEVTSATNDMATKTWVGTQNYVDETELAGKGYLTSTSLTDYAKTADVVTNGEFTTFKTSNTAAIADAKNAGTDAATAAATADDKAEAAQAAAEAAQGTATDALGKANTNAGAITALQAFDNSIKTATEGSVDGTYTLTMKKTGETMTFGWELIQRDGEGK